MYSDDDDLYTDDMSNGDYEEDEEELPDEPTKESPQKNCAVMHPDVIRQKQEEAISSISNVLAVSRVSAIILLLRYSWSVDNLKEAWFADEEKVRKAAGLFQKPIINQTERKQKLTCGICFEAYHHYEMHDAAGCGHLFCESCWEGYTGTSVDDGPGCLRLCCPDPACNAAVGQDMMNKFVCEESKQKYASYLLRSYIEDNKEFKWCPTPYCGLAIKFDLLSDNCDVTCECTYSFCWNCSKEAHRPADCSTMEKWVLKNSDEAENVTWILVNSKPCPNCKRPIEKGVGCNHMVCSICKFQFCWICLGSWNNHSSCNGYKEDGDSEKNIARKHLAKYTHYYERWVANHRSADHAVQSMKNMEIYSQLEELRFILCLDDEKELKFIRDAWEKIIECRRVLKWSYAFGYYLPEHEHGKIQLFEYLQGEAESGLENLHRFVEEKLQVFLGLDFDAPLENFKKFREALEKKTTVTGDHFEKLISAFKDGLSEVQSQGAGSSNKERAAYEYGGEGQKYAGTTSLNHYSSEYSDDDDYY
ncbi:hypothetical protein MKW92_015931 [Papaver armeniacum]|nr:hypothetical protein MKW92_015931 [Papaver armeniacum]